MAFFERFCIAEHQTACRQWLRQGLLAVLMLAWVPLAQAQAAASAAAASAPAPHWVGVPRVTGRLRAPDIGLVINTADPYSVAVGAYYQQRRGLRPVQILRVELPLLGTLKPEEFESLRAAIDAHFGPETQALALAWSQPYAVECNSITGALALGFDADLCRHSCAASRASAYANSPSARPLRDHGVRLSMLLAARDVEGARRLIDRGVAADRSLGLRGALPAQVYFLTSDDGSRNVRARLYPPSGPLRRVGLEVHVEPAAAWTGTRRALLVQTGSVRLPAAEGIEWVDGGLGDHLTSYGGRLGLDTGQAGCVCQVVQIVDHDIEAELIRRRSSSRPSSVP